MVNKSLLIGVALGVGFATAGGVTAYQFLGTERSGGGTAMIEPADTEHDAHAAHDTSAQEGHGAGAHDARGSTEVAAPAPARETAPVAAPAPARETAPVAAPVAASSASAPAATPVREECYEEAVANEPRDKHRIAGTAIGAIVGGAVAKDVGDRDLTTAVGAAVGAFAGNKIQERIQERRADGRVEVRCVPAQ